MNKKVFLWIFIAIIIAALLWGALSLFSIGSLKGADPIPEGEPAPPKNDVYQGVKIDDKTYQGVVLGVDDESFSLRIEGEETVFLFTDDSKHAFELLKKDGKKTALYIEKVISY